MRTRNYWQLKLHRPSVGVTSNRNFSTSLRVSPDAWGQGEGGGRGGKWNDFPSPPLPRMDVSRGAQAHTSVPVIFLLPTPTFFYVIHRYAIPLVSHWRSDARRSSRRHYFLDHFLNSSQLFPPLFARILVENFGWLVIGFLSIIPFFSRSINGYNVFIC